MLKKYINYAYNTAGSIAGDGVGTRIHLQLPKKQNQQVFTGSDCNGCLHYAG
jgi:hypothetical protein